MVSLGVVAALLLAACASDSTANSSGGRCVYHIQGEYGNHTKWGPCPSPYPEPPWTQRNR